jgi:hypothetical protein
MGRAVELNESSLRRSLVQFVANAAENGGGIVKSTLIYFNISSNLAGRQHPFFIQSMYAN